jgi:hypothetical protein
VQSVVGFLERRESRRLDLVNTALGYLTGGAQKRSVGIAMLEGMWPRLSRFHAALVPALTNQAVYLVLHSNNGASRNEIHNWLRIMKLLTEQVRLDRYHESRCELSNALDLRFDPGHEGGVHLPLSSLERWLLKVGEPLGGCYDEWKGQRGAGEPAEQADAADAASPPR